MPRTHERPMRPTTARARAAAALVASAMLVGLLLVSAPRLGAAPATRVQDDPTTTSVEDAPVPTLLRSTTSTTEASSTTAPDESTTTTEASTATTRGSSGAAPAATADPDVPAGADLLIRGDGTEGAELTTPTVRGTRISASGPSDGTLISLVIVGLAIVALAIGILTWRYWAATRPPLLDPDEGATAE